jgi:hypothetical protein
VAERVGFEPDTTFRSVSCRFYIARIAIDASDAVAPCTGLHRGRPHAHTKAVTAADRRSFVWTSGLRAETGKSVAVHVVFSWQCPGSGSVHDVACASALTPRRDESDGLPVEQRSDGFSIARPDDRPAVGRRRGHRATRHQPVSRCGRRRIVLPVEFDSVLRLRDRVQKPAVAFGSTFALPREVKPDAVKFLGDDSGSARFLTGE